jgi:hypothetical protein
MQRPARSGAGFTLALCDAQSFTDDDLIAGDLVYATVRGETSRVAYTPAHRWYYFSEML